MTALTLERSRLLPDLPSGRPCADRGSLTLDLPMRHAGTRRVELRWEAVGAADLPAVWVAGGISAHRHVIAHPLDAEPGWWEMQAPALDPARYRIVAFDWLGADGTLDAVIDPVDQANAIVAVLDALGIARLQAFIGSSYGAMVGLQLAAKHPERVARLLAISGTHRAHPHASALRAVQRRIVQLGALQCDAVDGLALARELAMLSYRTPAEFDLRFAATTLQDGQVRAGADGYLRHCGQRYAARTSPTAFLRLNESIDLQSLEPATIRIPVTVVGIAEDALVPAADSRALAQALPDAQLRILHSLYGHDAFLKEVDAMAMLISDTLNHGDRA